jgi:diguanylate cyclase (GGDEF)-like protein
MLTPALPANELERSLELENLGLIYSPSEEKFDRITRLAKRFFDVPIVLVSLVYKDIQWFKSSQGLNACETGRDVSFCGHAILKNEIFVVENALEDIRFSDNPLVIGEPRVIFYAGHPLYSPKGVVLGTLCLIDHKPRTFSDENKIALADFAAITEMSFAKNTLSDEQLNYLRENKEQQRKALLDPLLGVWSAEATAALLKREVKLAQSAKAALSVLIVEPLNIDELLQQLGHDIKTDLLKFIAQNLRASIRTAEIFGINKLGQFFVVLPKTPATIAKEFGAAIERRCALVKFKKGDIQCSTLVKVSVHGMSSDQALSAQEFSRQVGLAT